MLTPGSPLNHVSTYLGLFMLCWGSPVSHSSLLLLLLILGFNEPLTWRLWAITCPLSHVLGLRSFFLRCWDKDILSHREKDKFITTAKWNVLWTCSHCGVKQTPQPLWEDSFLQYDVPFPEVSSSSVQVPSPRIGPYYGPDTSYMNAYFRFALSATF